MTSIWAAYHYYLTTEERDDVANTLRLLGYEHYADYVETGALGIAFRSARMEEGLHGTPMSTLAGRRDLAPDLRICLGCFQKATGPFSHPYLAQALKETCRKPGEVADQEPMGCGSADHDEGSPIDAACRGFRAATPVPVVNAFALSSLRCDTHGPIGEQCGAECRFRLGERGDCACTYHGRDQLDPSYAYHSGSHCCQGCGEHQTGAPEPSTPERCACGMMAPGSLESELKRYSGWHRHHERASCTACIIDHVTPPVPSPAEIADALELAVKIGGNVACRAVQIGLRASAETSVNMGILRAAVAHLRRLADAEMHTLDYWAGKANKATDENVTLRAERDMLALHIEHNEAVLSEVVDQRDALALRVEQNERNCGRHHKVISDLTTEQLALTAKLNARPQWAELQARLSSRSAEVDILTAKLAASEEALAKEFHAGNLYIKERDDAYRRNEALSTKIAALTARLAEAERNHEPICRACRNGDHNPRHGCGQLAVVDHWEGPCACDECGKAVQP